MWAALLLVKTEAKPVIPSNLSNGVCSPLPVSFNQCTCMSTVYRLVWPGSMTKGAGVTMDLRPRKGKKGKDREMGLKKIH